MNAVAVLNSLLDQHFAELRKDSLNYVVHVKVYESENGSDRDVAEILKAVLRAKVVVGRTSDASADELVNDVLRGLRYEGDDGSHPGLEFLKSPLSQKALARIQSHLNALIDKSRQITRVEIEEGHPFYPVFWDYAYVAQKDGVALVIIGSSSD
jgi:hypothetical protein